VSPSVTRMPDEMHTILETNAFKRAAADLALSEDDRIGIATMRSDPKLGDLIPATGGARKFRYAPPGRGKRGGYRIITYFPAEDVPVFLLDIYAEGEKINLTKAECNAIGKALANVADDCRASIRARLGKTAENER